jgi:hypothetical protein
MVKNFLQWHPELPIKMPQPDSVRGLRMEKAKILIGIMGGGGVN